MTPAQTPNGLWTDDPRTLLRADAGFDLAAFDRAGTPGWDGSKADAQAFMARRGELLSELQERLFAEARFGGERSVLLVVQGLDTAGKGGIARHVLGMVDPQGVALSSFGVPTPEEAAHHFLWRIKRALPAPGRIGLFDRSHYEDVLVRRVEELDEPDVIERRYGEITRFEKRLAESGTTIIKVALMVSKDEQGLRLMERIDRPDKRWKYNAGDVDTRAKWDDYQDAYQAVLDRTSTAWAPWYVIPADRKWYARLAITELLTQTLVDLAPEWPKPRWRPDVQRRRLAQTMSAEALRESAEETVEAVDSGLEASRAVAEAAVAADSLGEDALETVATLADRAAAALAALDARHSQERDAAEAAAEQKLELAESAPQGTEAAVGEAPSGDTPVDEDAEADEEAPAGGVPTDVAAQVDADESASVPSTRTKDKDKKKSKKDKKDKKDKEDKEDKEDKNSRKDERATKDSLEDGKDTREKSEKSEKSKDTKDEKSKDKKKSKKKDKKKGKDKKDKGTKKD